ncbi:F-box protein at1g61340 [Phtheirospermum japonicum]|uniref:F-box protein at1g61340 n=1 Tax=Phtheirospermum japonicum TaxID=374723 RepID=A0A830B694_9LAMI|nr:F-box protein at1g61340 [Phtheirospermum japonicum]
MKRGNGEYGMGLVRSTSFGRKGVALPNVCLNFGDDNDDCVVSAKRQCFQDSFLKTTSIEDLPQEILIRVLCGVEHDDLKSLFFVSKAIREATVVAKQSHFAYSTPRKTVGFPSVEDFDSLNDTEAPNAPKQSRIQRSRLSAKKLGDISVNLFGSDNEVSWPR